MPVARRSRQSTLANRSTNSRSTADLSVILGNHCSFEGLVIFLILERGNDGLGGEAMAHRIAA